MSRLPFDPKRAKGPESTGEPPARRERKLAHVGEAGVLTVSQLSELIRTTLEQRISSPLRVVGELSNLNVRHHWYFSLKDEENVLSCVAWASTAKAFSDTFSDGDEVVATGHVSHYGPQGRTQLYVSKLARVGAGELEQRFRAMCDELRRLGYFEESRKKPLPVFPRRIAVITSRTSAALQDVIATAAQRCKAVGLLVVDVRVQGEGAAEQIAGAIDLVSRDHERLGVDAILVTRGGCSIEDLWAFNERVVADAALRCSIPLVAAIGHESDTTVIELVADVRAATPTQAAMRLAPSAEGLHQQVDHVAHRLDVVLKRRLERAAERLEHLAARPVMRDAAMAIGAATDRVARLQRHLHGVVRQRLSDEHVRLERLAGRWSRLEPAALVAGRRERITALSRRLRDVTRWRLRSAHHRIGALHRELDAVDPANVLKRGFSLTFDRDGALVRTTDAVRSGDLIMTRLVDGAVSSVVMTESGRPRGSRPSGLSPADQMDLFSDDQ